MYMSLSCQKQLFSLPEDIYYLNCATMSPNLKSVEQAGIQGVLRKSQPHEITQETFFETTAAVRPLFAQLINCPDPERIALIPSASYGMAIVAKNLAYKPGLQAGQEIVLVHEEFPSDVYAWEEVCKDKQLKINTTQPSDELQNRGKRWNERILEAITSNTCMVVLPHVHWADGTKYDLVTMAQRARQVGAWFVVDGTQSVGALPFDTQVIQPDALICAGYKWLLGPYSAGVAYFSETFDNGLALEQNWINRNGSEEFSQLIDYQAEYRPKAARYSVGEQSNFILMPMLEAALKQLLDWQPERIQQYCKELTTTILPKLKAAGYWIEDEAWRSSHLFGIRLPPHIDITTVKQALAVSKVQVSFRGNAIRVSPQVYNEKLEMELLAEVLLSINVH